MVEAAHNDYSALWKAQAESKSGGDHSSSEEGECSMVTLTMRPGEMLFPA